LRPLCVVPVAELDLPNLRALAYAVSLRQPTLAVHLCPDQADAERFLREWRAWGDHVPLEIVASPYRAFVPPLVHSLGALRAQEPRLTITVVMSDLVVPRLWQRPLHERSGERVRRALRSEPNTVITVVPFHLPPRPRTAWRTTAGDVETATVHAAGGRHKSRPLSEDKGVALGEHSAR
jgi:hypothetical protein